MRKLDRYYGALLGLAAGDAVGTTVEFKRPGSFTPITDMVGGGPFQLPIGGWTDDTSMTLCLAESLVEKQGFDPADRSQSDFLLFPDLLADQGSLLSSPAHQPGPQRVQ